MSPITPPVSPLSILFMCVTLLICFGLPIALAICAKIKYKKTFSFVPLALGVAAFVVAQIVFRQFILGSVLSLFDWYRAFVGDGTGWAYLIYACFLAGLVEEPARFAVFSMLKKSRAYPDGLSYGIGHGGIEAMILVGLTYINNLVISLMLNSGATGALGGAIPQEALAALSGTPSYLFLLGGLERVFAMLIHIALSLLVLQGFRTGRKGRYLLAAILLHGVANVDAVVGRLAGPLAAEGAVLVVGVIALLYILRQARQWRRCPEQPQEAALAPQ